MKTLYEAKATARGGRNGHVTSSDGVLDLNLSVPKGLGGPGKPFTNPEQLFAAGYAACFDNALAYVAAQRQVKLTGSWVDAAVSIGHREGGGFQLAVRLEVSLPDVPREHAQELVNAAHAACPYSNAVRNNIEVSVALA
jgi:Ohr subfamily peroxiredoxin